MNFCAERYHKQWQSLANHNKIVNQRVCVTHPQALTRSRIPATPALRDQRRLRPHALDALLIGLPVDGGDGGRALELEVSASLEVLLTDFEAEAEDARLEAVVLWGHLKMIKGLLGEKHFIPNVGIEIVYSE